MKSSVKKFLKWSGIVVGVMIVLALALGAYIYSILPKNIGSPVQLQAELFQKPSQPFPMDGKYIYKSATELASLIRSHQVTSLEVVTEFLNNIKNNNYKYNALIWIREQEAITDAKLADEMIAKGDTLNKPLLGVPVTIKEIYWVKGSPSTMNAKMYGFIAPEDAVVVSHLKEAGAIILGTTNVPYMLQDYQTQGEVYPTASNPYDTTRTPGGSTGGGAAALAAGFTSLELGSDLGGSIRIPSVFCGLYGLKTTFGAINITEGGSPDTVTKYTRLALASGGPLARTPEDLQLMWDVLKTTPQDKKFYTDIHYLPTENKALGQIKLAWIGNWKHGNRTASIGSDLTFALERFIDSLRINNVQVTDTAPDLYDDMEKNFFGTFSSMIGEGQPWLLRKLIGMDLKKWGEGDTVPNENFKAALEALDDASDEKWIQLVNDRKKLIAKWEEFFKQYDFFICPVTYGPAIKKCPPFSNLTSDDGVQMPYFHYFQYAVIFNATGHPSITIPMGLTKNWLPVGIQIVGPYYSEDRLLQFAKMIEPFTSEFIKPQN